MRHLLLLACFSAQLVGLIGQPIEFEKLTSAKGLSHSTVYAISQDLGGYLWLGTREGLNRYDGYDIHTYYKGEQGLLDDGIVALAPALDSGMWVGTHIGLFHYNSRRDTFYQMLYEGKPLGNIFQIYPLSSGQILFCTSQGLFCQEVDQSISLLSRAYIPHCIVEYKKDIFWVALGSGKLLMINASGEEVQEIRTPFFRANRVSGASKRLIQALFKDMDGHIWVATNQGLFEYDAQKDTLFNVFPSVNNQSNEAQVIRTLNQDSRGNFWIGTEAGLFILDLDQMTVSHIGQSLANNPNALNDKAIYSIFMSQEGIAWIGTYFGGVNYAKPPGKSFRKLIADGSQASLSGKAVSEITQLRNGEIWLGTEDGGITILSSEHDSLRYVKHKRHDPESLSSNNVHTIVEDSSGYVWIGTFMQGLDRYDPATQTVRHYRHNPADIHSLSNDYVYSLLLDNHHQLWIGTQDGLNRYDPVEDKVIRMWPSIFTNYFIYDIHQDRTGTYWFCSRAKGIVRYNPDNDQFTHFSQESYPTMSSNQVICVSEDHHGSLWFGTLGGGAMRYDAVSDHFEVLNQASGLPNENVYRIEEDSQHRLWFSTNKGLSVYQRERNCFTNYDMSHGLPSNQFNFRSSLVDAQGNMYFGTVRGLCYFHPDSLQLGAHTATLHFTDLRLFSELIQPGSHPALAQHIDFTPNLTLPYKENVLTLQFTAIDYLSPSNLHYAYYLEGFEDKWNEIGNQRSLTYTNLSPGTYTLHVKVAATKGGNAIDHRQMVLTILPPWWFSQWAIACYLVLVALAIAMYLRVSRYLQSQKLALELEQIEKQQIKELNQHKLNFFTYITHEFKTPLTLILTQVEKLLGDHHAEKKTNSEDLHLVRRNASRLRHLINQLLEFRKVESDHASLKLVHGDIVLFIRDTFEAFQPLFQKKQIDPQFQSNKPNFKAYFDADKITQILTNLLSNAIKNTGELGEVYLNLSIQPAEANEKTAKLFLKIGDSGVGILKNDSQKVFLPFYQTAPGLLRSGGSGIGLALVNSLIQFLDGKLTLDSSPDKGTQISIELPIRIADTREAEAPLTANTSLLIDQDLFEDDAVESLAAAEHELEVLIVEDNRELRTFLARHFRQIYRVRTAQHGLEALDKIKHHAPDLILSDVLMPKLDGLQLCHQLKEADQTSHIPIVLLSSQSEINHKIEGLEVGADAYLPKPFSLREAELTVMNLLMSRQTLREYFLQFGQWHTDNVPTNNKDLEFLQKILGLVNAHYEDPNLTVASLAREAGLSRSLLHTKLKKIADLSPSELIKTVRLQKGAQLLSSGFSVAEAAYQCGFSDPNYFGRQFKKYFKLNPRAYQEQAQNKLETPS